MLGNIFAIIQLILKLIGLWDQFMAWSDSKRLAEAQVLKQERDKAINDALNAQTEEEFNSAQARIVNSKPRP